jgi:subtilase family serine protease
MMSLRIVQKLLNLVAVLSLSAVSASIFGVSVGMAQQPDAEQHNAKLLVPLSGKGAPMRLVQARQVPGFVSAGRAQTLRSVDLAKKLPLVLNLALSNEASLDKLLAALYDPRSGSFHKYLTPEQFDARFGATQQDYDQVIRWVQSKGLTVTGRSANRHLLEVEGTVAQINYAFNVSITTYRDMDRNREFFAPDREPLLDLTVPLAGISGLDDAYPKHSQLKRDPALALPESISAENRSTIRSNISGSGEGNTYLPSDMRAAY